MNVFLQSHSIPISGILLHKFSIPTSIYRLPPQSTKVWLTNLRPVQPKLATDTYSISLDRRLQSLAVIDKRKKRTRLLTRWLLLGFFFLCRWCHQRTCSCLVTTLHKRELVLEHLSLWNCKLASLDYLMLARVHSSMLWSDQKRLKQQIFLSAQSV